MPSPTSYQPTASTSVLPAVSDDTSPAPTAPAPQSIGSRAPGYTPVRSSIPEGSGIRRSAKACLFCRRGKARCDGMDSWPCRRCRDAGVECCFADFTQEELRLRMERNRGSLPVQNAPTSIASPLEARFARLEAELIELRRSHSTRLELLEETRGREHSQSTESASRGAGADSGSPTEIRPPAIVTEDRFVCFANNAFDLFWRDYSPLAPYIVPTSDTYEQVKERSPILFHCIIAVASRHSQDRELVEYNRHEALRLIRETVHSEKLLTMDDLKASLVWNAWLGKAQPPGHSVTLALQLDLPRSLETLLAAAVDSTPADELFELLMPACRIWLTLYAQDLWLSLAFNRRPLVTVDHSITSARLLLAFNALRPVDARLIAQSEIVSVLAVVKESFLKARSSVEHTVNVVQQANVHLEQWITTWSAWASTQEESSGRYIISSFSVMLHSGRFFANTLSLRDITSSEQLLPIHLPLLRTALDAAVRIQGIHRAQKIAHSAEMTMISLSSAALFLLKMIKLVPSAFAPIDSPAYPASSFTSSLAADVASSPDTSASTHQVSYPSIRQALAAARHSSALLACAPAQQQSYAHAVDAALSKLEGVASVLASGGKRPFTGDEAARPAPPAPGQTDPAASLGMSWVASGSALLDGQGQVMGEELTPPAGFWAADSSHTLDASFGAEGGGAEVAELDELAISSLIGTDSFWSWDSVLPGEGLQALMS